MMILLLSMGHFASAEENVTLQPFGSTHIYRPTSGRSDAMAILISGDGGWIHAVVDLAEKLSAQDTFVAGIDINQYLSGSRKYSTSTCLDAGRDFADLAETLRNRYMLPQSTNAVLIGYSSGATLAYAAIAQLPANTFSSAVSFGFCSDFEYSKPFCQTQTIRTLPMPNHKGTYVLPDAALQTPWIVFQGSVDQVCNPEITKDFVRQVPSGEFVYLPKVGHGFAKEKYWLPQFHHIFSRYDRASAKWSESLHPSELPDRTLGSDKE